MTPPPSNPTYGTLARRGDRWLLTDIPPFVAIRLKQMFARIPKTQTKEFSLPFTDEMSADLAWFMSRYPMNISDGDRSALLEQKTLFETDRAALHAITLPEWKPAGEVHGFRPGYAPNALQRVAIALVHKRRSLLLADDVGLGKEQPLTASILTPRGWSTMGDIRAGTEVVGHDGRPRRVLAVFPQGVKPVYRVTFSDGAATECGLDHLWLVRDQNRRRRGESWVVKPLSELLRWGVTRGDGTPKWEIPLARPIEFAPTDALPIRPYLLGALLGDGAVSGENIALSVPAHEGETLERIRSIVGAERVSGPFGGACPQWHILGERRGFNSVARSLKAMGLRVKSRHKFVPETYLRASVADRLELLRGLMDTDGSARSNRVTFHTTSAALARGVSELARSLGGTASIRAYDRAHAGKGVEFQVNVRLEVCPFHLSAKAAQWRRCETHGRVRRFIRSVDLVGSAEQQCISVDATDGTYLTDDFVVTHNTWSALGSLVGSPYLPAAVVVQTHLPSQWEREFIRPYTYLTSHIIEGTNPYSLPPANIYLFRYSNIAGWSDILATGYFKAAIFDEIQEGRTGLGTQRGAAMKVLADNVALRMGLSATPIYGYGAEIWNIMQYIDADLLGSFDDFAREWCAYKGNGKYVLKDPEAMGSYLRDSMVFLRRLREGRRINRLVIEVDYDEDVERQTLDLARDLAMRVVNGTFSESGQAARELDALARRTTGVAKALGVAATVRVLLESGKPVILTGWHRDVYDIWLKEFDEFRPVMYTGSESPKQKDRAKEDFIAGRSDLLILSNRSGVGLDGLQKRCSTVVIGELDWSPMIYEQIFGRVDRPGQPEDEITAIFCTVPAGSDPTVMAANAVKRNQSRGILDPGVELERLEPDVNHLRMLAEAYLARTS